MFPFTRIIGISLLLLAAAPASANERVSLCSKEERIAFSCTVGHKIASLCLVVEKDGTRLSSQVCKDVAVAFPDGRGPMWDEAGLPKVEGPSNEFDMP